jgi:hypothetical protein
MNKWFWNVNIWNYEMLKIYMFASSMSIIQNSDENHIQVSNYNKELMILCHGNILNKMHFG